MKFTPYLILVLSLVISSCGIFGGSKTTNSTQEKIIGTWDLIYMKKGDKTITADKFGGDAYIKFLQDGQVVSKLPGLKKSNSRYYIEGNTIQDLGAKEGGNMTIKSLETSDMVLSIDVNGEDVDLRFKKKG